MDKELYCYLTIATRVNSSMRVSVIDLSKEDRDNLLANEQIQLTKRSERKVSVFEYYKLNN